MSRLQSIRQIISTLEYKYKLFGGLNYMIDEPVSITEHSIQTALWLRNHKTADDYLIISGLLHDFGHLAKDIPIAPSSNHNDFHEIIGARELKKIGFPSIVTEPIRLHVLAKRYLYTLNPLYSLSKGSILSLSLQGGKLSPSQMNQFKNHTFFSRAVTLRHADDGGKSIHLKIARSFSFQDFEQEFYNVLKK